ncbi:carbamoyltransferase HypF [Actinobacillus pleuropneumoniae]|nr:carbamoyltransferase HypF [Actinobacillus pleuropneumoniae]
MRAACALGIVADQITWEGEAACKLENIAWQYAQTGETLRNGITISLNEHNQLNLADFWSDWLALEASSAEKAWIFHYSLAQGLANLARLQADKYHIKTIVLSGGVWHNRLLRYLINQCYPILSY